MTLKIAVLDDFQDVARGMADWGCLADTELTVFTDNCRGEALVERLLPFDAICAIRERSLLPRSVIERLPRLRFIATAGMRNRGIDLQACAERGITVCGTPVGSSPTAELAFGMVLALSRNILAEDRSLRAGTWMTTSLASSVLFPGENRAVFMRLGSQMARYAQAFGMQTIAWSTNLTAQRAEAEGCRLVTKEALFEQSDYVSLHLIMSARSRHTVAAPELGRMRPSAFLVNTSRSGLVDGPALVAALTERRLAGAALDVFDEEPMPPGDPLLRAPNTLLTPHLGYATRESYESYFPAMVEDLAAWQAGSPIRVLPLE